MEISKNRTGTIILKGQMVVSEIESIHSHLEPVLDESLSNIVMDLSSVTEIDTAGLQLLFSIMKTAEHDGSFRIKSISPAVKEAIDISGFGMLLKEVSG